MAEAYWYYSEGGRQQGPVAESVLRQLIASGRVQRTDVVWAEGMAEWAAAGNVPGLLSAFPATPPPLDPQQGQPPLAYATPAPYGYGRPHAQPGVGYYSPTGFVSYAGFGARFVALLIDGLILTVPLTAIGVGLFFALELDDAFAQMIQSSNSRGGGGGGPPVGAFPPEFVIFQYGLELIAILFQWLYYAPQESGKHQATFGKRAMGLRVTDVHGNRISFGRASGRNFGKVLSNMSCYVGYIMASFTERRQALHDMISGCLVVKARPE